MRYDVAVMEKMESRKGIWLVALAALLWSLNSPIVKGLSLDSLSIAAFRSLAAGVALAPFIRIRKIRWNVYALGMLLSFAALSTCIILGLKMTSAPIAVGTQFTAPVWLYLVERKKGQGGLRRIWPLLLLVLGVFLFMCSKAEGVSLKGNLVALSTSFSFAALTYCAPRCASENPLGMTAISCLFTALLLLFFVDAPLETLRSASAGQILTLVLLGVVQTGAGYGCYYMGLRYTNGRTAAQIAPLEMILGPLWVALFLHEYPDILCLLGFALVLAGVFGEAYVSARQERKESI